MLGATHAIFPVGENIEFDTSNYQSTGSSSNSISINWSHTASGENRFVLVYITVLQQTEWYYNHSRTVTYGGVQMTSIGAEHANFDSTKPWVEIFYLKDPPTGAQTVNVTVARASTGYFRLSAVSLSYKNCRGVYNFSKNSGSGSGGALSQTVNSLNSTEVISQGFLTYQALVTGSITAYNQTQRYTLAATGAGADNAMLVGDAQGANPSVTFTATRNASTALYASVAVVLTRDYLYREENINRVNYPVPSQAVDFRVKLIGAGGAGGNGHQGGAQDCGGGGGGGGGAVLDTGWQSVSQLGSTFSLYSGNGASGSDGPASFFTSGSVSLSAGGGYVGANGIQSSTNQSAGGAGGTSTVSGLSGVTTIDGTQGGSGGSGRQATTGNAPATPNNTAGGAAGGGGGGGMSGFNVGTPGQGAKGGDSLYSTGGATGRPGVTPAYDGLGGAGAGGGSGNNAGGSNAGGNGAIGGMYGGGGGGGSGAGSSRGIGGAGGPGYTLIEFR